MKKIIIIHISNKETSFKKVLDKNKYDYKNYNFKDITVFDLINFKEKILFIEPESSKDISFLLKYTNKIINSPDKWYPVFIKLTNNNEKLTDLDYDNNIFLIESLDETTIISYINIGEKLIHNSKNIYNLKKDLIETRQYFSTKIDNILLLDYCLRKVTKYINTNDLIINSLKLLTHKMLFNFETATFYYTESNKKYKHYKSNDTFLFESSDIPKEVKQVFLSSEPEEKESILVYPIFLNKKIYGAFYIKKNKFENEEDFLIARLFLKELNLKIEMSELQVYTEELKKINRSKSDFLTLVTHELKTPLTIVLPSVDMLTDMIKDKLEENEKDFVDQVIDGLKNGVYRLNTIVEDILLYLSLSTEKIDYAKQISNPDLVVNDIILSKSNLFEEEKINLTLNLSNDNNNMILYYELFVKGIEIILDNSIKFTKHSSDPNIYIDSYYTNDDYILVIKDTGIGIEESYLKKLFNPLEILQDIDNHHKGIGLNLNIAKMIFEIYHNGKLSIESEKKQGTTVTITISRKNQ